MKVKKNSGMMKTKALLASLLLMASGLLMAQTPDAVGGVVVDENGEPVYGAQVEVKGAGTGAVTDADGRFSLPNVKRGDPIVVSYLGMTPQTLKAAPGMKVRLRSKDERLNEVVVVAFGEQKKSSFTGSAGTVGAEKIAERQVNNVADALEGQVAGVQMVKTSGDPTAAPSFHIRGISSIYADQTPLIVVDGAPFAGNWNDINPADVASITVLKDAASNALYGARGANGVIMITTKTPEKGKTVISLDAKWGATSRASQTYDMITAPGQYYELHYNALYNNYVANGMSAYNAHVAANNTLGKTTSEGGLGYVCYTVPDGEYLVGDNGKLNPNAKLGNVVEYNGQKYTIRPDDWLKEAFRTTLRQEYNLNVNGGNDASDFYASVGYLNQPGIAYGSEYERYSARLKASFKASDWLKIGGNVSYAHSVSDYAADGDTDAGNNVFYTINNIAPIYPLYLRDGEGRIMTDANGKMMDYGDNMNAGLSRPVLTSTNPLKDDLLQSSRSVGNSFNLMGYADITPSFVKGLKITLNGTVNEYEYRYTMTKQPYYGWGQSIYPGGYVYKAHNRYFTTNFQQLARYVHSFGLHNMTLLLGHENYDETDETLGASRIQMLSYFENQELSGAVREDASSSTQTNYNTEGYFFRGMYDYNETYFGQFSFRRDASSRFHPDHRWGNFYSLGGAWIVSKEKWMERTRPWFDMLKLKASFGQQGNDGIGSDRYRDTYDIRNFNDQVAVTLYAKGNPNITWETNTNVNAGVEFEMFKRRLRGGVDFFYRKTTDMLTWVLVPKSEGYSGYYDNVGDMVNKGVEMELSYDIVRNQDVYWNVNLNATHYRNKITALYAENKRKECDGYYGFTGSYHFYGEGLPMYTWRIKKYAGVDGEGNAMWYKKLDDGTVTTTADPLDEDASMYFLCGDPTPDLYGGFGTSLSYRGFDLSVSFSYSIGGQVYDYGYQSLMGSPYESYTGYNYHKDILKAWSVDNANSDIPRFQYGDRYQNISSDRFLTNGSWLSLQNINLGYTLPQAWVNRAGLSKIRVYASADNVAFWSKRKGLDPRTSFSGGPGAENYSFTRCISGGINIQF